MEAREHVYFAQPCIPHTKYVGGIQQLAVEWGMDG
jgi:hypothetical protein